MKLVAKANVVGDEVEVELLPEQGDVGRDRLHQEHPVLFCVTQEQPRAPLATVSPGGAEEQATQLPGQDTEQPRDLHLVAEVVQADEVPPAQDRVTPQRRRADGDRQDAVPFLRLLGLLDQHPKVRHPRFVHGHVTADEHHDGGLPGVVQRDRRGCRHRGRGRVAAEIDGDADPPRERVFHVACEP